MSDRPHRRLTRSLLLAEIFFDFLTTNFDGAVKPVPILQTINIIFGIITFVYEWPLKFVAGTPLHRSIEFRLFWLPLMSLGCSLMYQAMDPALYYLIGLVVYFWAYSEGEVCCCDCREGLEEC